MHDSLYGTCMISFMPCCCQVNLAVNFYHFVFLSCVILIFLVSQEYTNTDNPFGDAHLLETFVWQKVRLP